MWVRRRFPVASPDVGITLIELLIAAVITAFLALAIGRTFTNFSNSLEMAADDSLTTQAVLRMSSLVKYDFAGARDAYIFGKTPPTDTSKVCSSWRETANSLLWTDPAQQKFVLPLFTLQIVGTAYSATSSSAPAWQPMGAHTQYVGYEIRRTDNASLRKSTPPGFVLWRVTCTGTGSPNASIASAEQLLLLGVRLPAKVVTGGVVVGGGNVMMLCDDAACTTGVSTSAVKKYAFAPPYSGDRFGRGRRVASNYAQLAELQTLKRRVDV